MAPVPSPKWLVLEHAYTVTNGSTNRLSPGTILDGGGSEVQVSQLIDAGFAIVPYNDATMGEAVRKFTARPRRHGDPYGDLVAVLIVVGALPLPIGP